jgi:hypothetical protein
MKQPLPFCPLIKRAALLFLLLTSFNFATQAQDCGCDFVIKPPESPTTTLFVNGDNLGVKPGQTICLTAGVYFQIRFTKISGEPGNPVIIKNCGGLAQIGDDINFGRWYATDIVGCKYIRYTGTGDPSIKYGIKLGRSGDSALKIGGASTNIEIDHLEIANANFAGILAKTDYRGFPPPDASEMNNLNIHDNYVHDTRGEGMYIGETKSPGENMRHLEIWNNVITRTGLDLIQVANAVEDVQVHHNVFYASGLRNVLYQNKGFQIGDNSVGRYYNNFVIGSPSNSMIVLGSGDIEITNNYLSGAGDPAFFIDNRAFTIPGAPVDIHNNYIMEVSESDAFFTVFNEVNPISITANKLEGDNRAVIYGSGAGPNVTVTDTTDRVAIERVQFTDVANDDFTLAPGSPYQDLGLLSDVSGRNPRPYINLIANQTLDFGTTAEVPVSAADPDGDAIIMEAFDLPSFVTFKDNGGGSGMLSLAPQPGDEGVYYKVRVRVTDSEGAMNTQYFHITVLDPYAFLATASSSLAPHLPENTLDGDLLTRWAAATGSGNWIQYDLREDKTVTSVDISFYNGATTVYPFNIEVSEDGTAWTSVFSGTSSGATAEFESFAFDAVRARYLRIMDNGSMLNSYNEVVIHATTAPIAHSFSASDDLYVDGKRIINDASLKVKESRAQSYLRFEVRDLDVAASPVVSAILKLTATSGASGTVKIYLGDDATWSESNAGHADLPRAVHVLDTLTADFSAGQQYQLDVSSAIADNGLYNFILVAEDTRGNLTFSSAEGQFQPELLVETLRGAETSNSEISDSSDLPDDLRATYSPVRLYPNPVVTDNVTVDLGLWGSPSVSVEIADESGQPRFRGNWKNAGQFIEIALNEIRLESGLYLVKVKREGYSAEILRMYKR